MSQDLSSAAVVIGALRVNYLTSMDYSSWVVGWNSQLAPIFGLVWSYTLIKLFKCKRRNAASFFTPSNDVLLFI